MFSGRNDNIKSRYYYKDISNIKNIYMFIIFCMILEIF